MAHGYKFWLEPLRPPTWDGADHCVAHDPSMNRCASLLALH